MVALVQELIRKYEHQFREHYACALMVSIAPPGILNWLPNILVPIPKPALILAVNSGSASFKLAFFPLRVQPAASDRRETELPLETTHA